MTHAMKLYARLSGVSPIISSHHWSYHFRPSLSFQAKDTCMQDCLVHGGGAPHFEMIGNSQTVQNTGGPRKGFQPSHMQLRTRHSPHVAMESRPRRSGNLEDKRRAFTLFAALPCRQATLRHYLSSSSCPFFAIHSSAERPYHFRPLVSRSGRPYHFRPPN